MVDIETAKMQVAELVKKLDNIKANGKLKDCNEENTKKDFITPLFRILGWDIENTISFDEVTNEDKVSKGRVDYAFRINGIPKFFLEAKALNKGLDLSKDAFQSINYSWHKGTVWAILTDFRTLIVYNAEVKEANPSQAQFFSLTYDQFIENFERLWWLSKPAMIEGLLDKAALSWGKKFKKTKVDDQLFRELMYYREKLSKDIKKNNIEKDLKDEEIDEAVQKIIDRLIFIRTTEDRGIEAPYLTPIIRAYKEKKTGKITQALNIIYQTYDKVYNSKLFSYNLIDFNQRHLCETLEIDNDVLLEVIEGLYESRDGITHYDFSAIDADVLGNIYEQYLSQILRSTEKRVKIESKEAHRHDKGIYYTPTYIVNYIVNNTISPLLNNKTPVDADALRVLDMACGSGSFLLKSFDYIDEFYKVFDKNNQQSQGNSEENKWRISRKTNILRFNIYGVDLDPKAVEIAQLNLLLKAAETKHRLPDLRDNIRCGNSLIDDHIVAGAYSFNWNYKFASIMKEGGFNVIIGNPLYIRPHKIPIAEKEYFWKNYESFKAKSDIYNCFIERGIMLLKPSGVLGFIVPHTWISLESFVHIRKKILDTCKVIKLVQLPKKVFQDATVETCIVIIQKEEDNNKRLANEIVVERLNELGIVEEVKRHKQSKILSNYLYNFELYSEATGNTIFEKLNKLPKLGSIVDFSYGLKTGDDEKFISTSIKDENSKPLIRSADIGRYSITYSGEYVWYVPTIMTANKKTARPGDKERFERNKLIVGRMGKELFAAYDSNNYYVKDGMLLTTNNDSEPLLYVLGLINSRLLNYYYQNFFITIDVLKNALLNLPIPISNEQQKLHLASLVDDLCNLHANYKRMGDKFTDERSHLDIEIAEKDREIDEFVYGLYGLTEEEINMIQQ